MNPTVATGEVRHVQQLLFWGTAVFVFVIRQVIVLMMIARRVPPRFRVRAFLFGRWSTPRSLLVAAVSSTLEVLLLFRERLARVLHAVSA